MDGTNSFKPDLLKGLLEDSKLVAGETIMIGDRHHDIDGAKANQVASIAVTWGYGNDEEFENAGPDYICNSPEGILAIMGA